MPGSDASNFFKRRSRRSPRYYDELHGMTFNIYVSSHPPQKIPRILGLWLCLICCGISVSPNCACLASQIQLVSVIGGGCFVGRTPKMIWLDILKVSQGIWGTTKSDGNSSRCFYMDTGLKIDTFTCTPTREPVGVTGQYGAASDSTSWTIRNISTPKNQMNTHKYDMLLEIINIIISCQHVRSAFLSQISNNRQNLRMVFEFDCYFYIIFSWLNNDLPVLI